MEITVHNENEHTDVFKVAKALSRAYWRTAVIGGLAAAKAPTNEIATVVAIGAFALDSWRLIKDRGEQFYSDLGLMSPGQKATREGYAIEISKAERRAVRRAAREAELAERRAAREQEIEDDPLKRLF